MGNLTTGREREAEPDLWAARLSGETTSGSASERLRQVDPQALPRLPVWTRVFVSVASSTSDLVLVGSVSILMTSGWFVNRRSISKHERTDSDYVTANIHAPQRMRPGDFDKTSNLNYYDDWRSSLDKATICSLFPEDITPLIKLLVPPRGHVDVHVPQRMKPPWPLSHHYHEDKMSRHKLQLVPKDVNNRFVDKILNEVQDKIILMLPRGLPLNIIWFYDLFFKKVLSQWAFDLDNC